MGDKEHSGNFYKTDRIEETPDDCPSCVYQNKRTKENPDKCPNCYYIPNKEKKEGQE